MMSWLFATKAPQCAHPAAATVIARVGRHRKGRFGCGEQSLPVGPTSDGNAPKAAQRPHMGSFPHVAISWHSRLRRHARGHRVRVALHAGRSIGWCALLAEVLRGCCLVHPGPTPPSHSPSDTAPAVPRRLCVGVSDAEERAVIRHYAAVTRARLPGACRRNNRRSRRRRPREFACHFSLQRNPSGARSQDRGLRKHQLDFGLEGRHETSGRQDAGGFRTYFLWRADATLWKR
jgi:hypothetical protein